MGRMPNGERAVLDLRKLEDYCLSPSHFRGRHKARVFRQALGLDRSHASWLREALLQAARTSEATGAEADTFGSRWQIDLTLTRYGRTAVIRSVWIIRTGEDVPRFVTAWVP
jgi:hypothetical protein